MRRAVLLAVAGLAVYAPAAPAAAAPRPLAPLQPDALPASPFGAPVRDRVIRSAPAARAALLRRLVPGHYFRTKGGTRILVVVSPSYRFNPSSIQSFVDFLDGLPHGGELGRLRLVIETPAEIGRDCSTEALACYTTPGDILRVPGEDQTGEAPLPYIIAHEYGHHVAWHRSNAPFPAITFGPKRWASQERVCPGVAARHQRLFPGDEGRHYFDNPGEGWAESFAQNYYAENKLPNLPWRYSPLLTPDEASFRAVRADVKHPWRHRTGRSFTITGRNARRTVSTPLDGVANIRVRAPRGTRVSARLVAHGSRLPHGRVGGARGSLVCGPRSVQLRVTRTGRGPVRVTVLRP